MSTSTTPIDVGPAAPASSGAATAIALQSVTVSFGDHIAVRDVTADIPAGQVTALVGPSGCGKTSVLRAVNRMHDHIGGKVAGSVRLGDLDVYGPGVVAESVRSRVGMVFQRPNPFPTMSIYDNVVVGLRLAGIRERRQLRAVAERALHQAALWDIVKDRLNQPAVRLSGGQQQRLCIARALAVCPDVLLMDEPCSALDPIATAKVEALIADLVPAVTVVVVTHNLFQASRVADHVAVFQLADDRVGELAEFGPTRAVFDSPRDPRTQAYLTGHIG
jgi:phosphate transport system ATP-binding protein